VVSGVEVVDTAGPAGFSVRATEDLPAGHQFARVSHAAVLDVANVAQAAARSESSSSLAPLLKELATGSAGTDTM
jgi:hypothetical protein